MGRMYSTDLLQKSHLSVKAEWDFFFFFFWQASGNTEAKPKPGRNHTPHQPSVIHLISLSNELFFFCKNKIKDLSVPHIIIVGMDPLLISGFKFVHIQGMLNYLIGLLCGLAD